MERTLIFDWTTNTVSEAQDPSTSQKISEAMASQRELVTAAVAVPPARGEDQAE